MVIIISARHSLPISPYIYTSEDGLSRIDRLNDDRGTLENDLQGMEVLLEEEKAKSE